MMFSSLELWLWTPNKAEGSQEGWGSTGPLLHLSCLLWWPDLVATVPGGMLCYTPLKGYFCAGDEIQLSGSAEVLSELKHSGRKGKTIFDSALTCLTLPARGFPWILFTVFYYWSPKPLTGGLLSLHSLTCRLFNSVFVSVETGLSSTFSLLLTSRSTPKFIYLTFPISS